MSSCSRCVFRLPLAATPEVYLVNSHSADLLQSSGVRSLSAYINQGIDTHRPRLDSTLDDSSPQINHLLLPTAQTSTPFSQHCPRQSQSVTSISAARSL